MKLIIASTVLSMCFLASPVNAKTEFQKNSEVGVEETEEVIDGKKVRTIRSGKVQQRKGKARVGDISDDEITEVQRRQKSLHLAAAGFGPFGSSNIGKEKLMYGASFGYHWEVTTVSEIVAEAMLAANSAGVLLNAGIGFNYLPLRGDVSPIIGAMFGGGYGSGKNSDNVSISQGGFSGQANLGVRLFRLSETQLEIMGTYTGILSSPSPHVYGGQLRILF